MLGGSAAERAEVVELVDTWCSGRHGLRAREGSSPSFGTNKSRSGGTGRRVRLRGGVWATVGGVQVPPSDTTNKGE